MSLEVMKPGGKEGRILLKLFWDAKLGQRISFSEQITRFSKKKRKLHYFYTFPHTPWTWTRVNH
jgi:hypothetical protein